MHSFTPWSVLRQFYSHFKSQFSTECHLVFPLSVSRIPSFTKGHKYLLTPSSSSFRHFGFSFIIPSITRVTRLFLFKMWLIQLGLLHFMLCRMFSSSLTLRNTSLFFHTIYTDDLLHPSPPPCSKAFQLFLTYFPKLSKLQHHNKLCSKCRISLLSFLNLILIRW